jgi:hypothetical protein
MVRPYGNYPTQSHKSLMQAQYDPHDIAKFRQQSFEFVRSSAFEP